MPLSSLGPSHGILHRLTRSLVGHTGAHNVHSHAGRDVGRRLGDTGGVANAGGGGAGAG